MHKARGEFHRPDGIEFILHGLEEIEIVFSRAASKGKRALDMSYAKPNAYDRSGSGLREISECLVALHPSNSLLRDHSRMCLEGRL